MPRTWGQAIPRCGADLIGYYAPHEGSSTLAYGIYNVKSLADYETYRAKLANDPLGRQNYGICAEREVPAARGQDVSENCIAAAPGWSGMIAEIFEVFRDHGMFERAQARIESNTIRTTSIRKDNKS